jgi:hypothetical protein
MCETSTEPTLPFPPVRTSTSPVARILRDSAVLLAGGTVLLYLIADIYASCYLSALGAPASYHPFGVGELALPHGARHGTQRRPPVPPMGTSGELGHIRLRWPDKPYDGSLPPTSP